MDRALGVQSFILYNVSEETVITGRVIFIRDLVVLIRNGWHMCVHVAGMNVLSLSWGLNRLVAGCTSHHHVWSKAGGVTSLYYPEPLCAKPTRDGPGLRYDTIVCRGLGKTTYQCMTPTVAAA